MEEDYECSDEVFLDLIDGGSIEEVKKINTPEFLSKIKEEDRNKYQILCKNCLAKKYGVDPAEFDFIQTYGELP